MKKSPEAAMRNHLGGKSRENFQGRRTTRCQGEGVDPPGEVVTNEEVTLCYI